jgi:hypothetical protein
MSPNSYLSFNSDHELCGYDGDHDEPVHVWRYDDYQSEFDEILGEEVFKVTQSVYAFCCDHVESNMSRVELYSIQGGEYESEGGERDAVEAYLGLDEKELERLHTNMVRVLEERITKKQARLRAIDRFVEVNGSALDPESEVGREVREFLDERRSDADRKLADAMRKLAGERAWEMPPPMPDDEEAELDEKEAAVGEPSPKCQKV